MRCANGLLCMPLHDDLKPRISQVDVLRSESFLVRWDRPRRVDGELQRYEVKTFINSLEGPVILRSTSGNEHSLMMRGLDPYRNYFIQVTAVTSSGRSPPSDPLSVITDTAPSSSPLNLELTKITPRSVRLEREPPEMFYKNIDSYRVDMMKDGKLLRSESTKDTKIDLSDLEPGQLIVLRVFAGTRSLYRRKECEGEFAQLVFTAPPEATTSSRLTKTPPVGRTTNTPTKHSTPLSGKHTTNLTSKPRAMYGAPRTLLHNIVRLYPHTTNLTSKPRAMFGATRTLLQNIARLYPQSTNHVWRTTNTPTKHTTSGKHTTNLTSKPRNLSVHDEHSQNTHCESCGWTDSRNLIGMHNTSPSLKYNTNPSLKYNTNPSLKYNTNPSLKYNTNPSLKYNTNPSLKYNTNPSLKYNTSPSLKYNTSPSLKYNTSPSNKQTINSCENAENMTERLSHFFISLTL
ncbi:hypothetical protein RRG08_039156 [Elysia crispata]|uniref:Fibronectin type-III domain-containing protein n=1 Tax=Elysia crispata TaxID=231223 RepID=A0AAE1DY16_9GAST|nr:hypothetical protein RRG08_039156 [Elysia crispata]